MKTAISISDQLFKSAEELARRTGKSRSQLYSEAVKNYIEGHKSENITKKLDEVYTKEDSQLDRGLSHMQARSLPKEDW